MTTKSKAYVRRCAALALAAVAGTLSVSAQTPILTQHYDTARTGQNIAETILTPANVNSTTFGKLPFKLSVTGYVYAQPLYVPNVTIPGQGPHNVLYVATEHDLVYAFDADNGTQLWYDNFLINGATTLSPSDVGGTQDINPEIGITGTPTIDTTGKTLYVVVNTKESGNLIYRLHALDTTTGAEKFGGPVVLTASVPGSAPDGNGTTVPFNPQWANQRPGLLLYGGYLFIGFSSHGDNGPWHGWILAYNATTLAQTGVWCTSPNGKGNGIWAAGSGIAMDSSGNAFVATGNGDDTVTTPAPAPSTSIDYGDSIVRFSMTNGVPLPTDYFTPYNQGSLDSADEDVGSGGVLVLPDQGGPYMHILLQCGKQGSIYLVNRDKMTRDGSHYCNECSSDPEIIQTVTGDGGLWSMPAYWNGNVYMWANGGHLAEYSLINGVLSGSPTYQSAESSGFPGSTPVVSSSATSNGIVWAVETDAYTSSGPAILRAYSATNVSNLLYGSNLTSGRDTLGPAVKFVVPVVTNGKVYVGAQQEVDVFGLLASEPRAAAPTFSPGGGAYSASLPVTLSSTTAGAAIYFTIDGSTPSTSSTLYAGPITVANTTTINAIATASGYIQSTSSTATYTISSQTAPPTVSPAAGTYTSAQSVTLSDTTTGATIYYTTNGVAPTHSSTKYTAPIAVSSTTTIMAIASSAGLNDSPPITAVYTINPNATTINYGLGFSNPAGMQFNGSTDLDDSRLQLTNGGSNEAGSAFFTTPIDIRNFTTDFTFQLSDAMADGITFTLQNSSAGVTALGPAGGGLGYGPDTPGGTGGIPNSVAVKYDLYNNDGEGDDSTGLYTDGASPTVPAVDMTSSGVILNNGDTMAVHITYDGTTLTMTITDESVNATFTTSWVIDIPTAIGGNTAYAGFTGGTGGETASQKIETWTFASTPPAVTVKTPVFTPASKVFANSVAVSISDATSGATTYYTTDGSTPSPGMGTTQQYGPTLNLTATTTVNAIATLSGSTSAMATATYTLEAAATPTYSPAKGTIATTQKISILDATPGAAIYYTTDLSTPSAGVGTTRQYAAPFTLTASTSVKAIAIANGYAKSATGQATFTLQRAVAPMFGPAGGKIATTQAITISDSTPGAAMYYTIDGSTPSPGVGTTKKYGGPFTLAASATVKALATATGYLNGPVKVAAYTLQRATAPTFMPAAGKIPATQTITISDAISGAAIYYTIDGSTPSPGMGTTKKYSGAFTLASSAAVKAMATATGYLNSPMASAAYSL
jgi:hypothetical protein